MYDIPEWSIHALSEAIITQAVKDYAKVLRRGDSASGGKEELERFFHSKLFALATDGYPPELFIARIKGGEGRVLKAQYHRSEGQKRYRARRKAQIQL